MDSVRCIPAGDGRDDEVDRFGRPATLRQARVKVHD